MLLNLESERFKHLHYYDARFPTAKLMERAIDETGAVNATDQATAIGQADEKSRDTTSEACFLNEGSERSEERAGLA